MVVEVTQQAPSDHKPEVLALLSADEEASQEVLEDRYRWWQMYAIMPPVVSISAFHQKRKWRPVSRP